MADTQGEEKSQQILCEETQMLDLLDKDLSSLKSGILNIFKKLY